ncbi:hypothetical protein [Paenibacillus cremeus]|uniref:Uncharacterized protein n=1 Tax=Paenibacillus cremeus TaxID=2163881 RepID=A0A559KHH8_9BACL|nr:hypothetical protein [Paenibacillus cremeus]TVY11581.1 hypothetical protein FPZ49_02445 [Paenibacillus cremeus]
MRGKSTPATNRIPEEHKQTEAPAAASEDEHYLPPRKSVHPPEKEKYVHYFYRSLLWMFILLVAGLFVWGWKLVST